MGINGRFSIYQMIQIPMFVIFVTWCYLIPLIAVGGNGAWPPVRGIFNWRLTFIGAAAEP